VKELDRMLASKRIGLVAHYYMDPELQVRMLQPLSPFLQGRDGPCPVQGTLSALKWPHVFVADSLAMGEAAVKMASSGAVDSVICMGVDFMAESVRATLDSNDFKVSCMIWLESARARDRSVSRHR
jgi:quinolinate synthase